VTKKRTYPNRTRRPPVSIKIAELTERLGDLDAGRQLHLCRPNTRSAG